MPDNSKSKSESLFPSLHNTANLRIVGMERPAFSLKCSVPYEGETKVADQKRIYCKARVHEDPFLPPERLLDGKEMRSTCNVNLVRDDGGAREEKRAVGVVQYFPDDEGSPDGSAGPEDGFFQVYLILDPDQFDFVCRSIWAGEDLESLYLTVYSEKFEPDHHVDSSTVHWPGKEQVRVTEFSISMYCQPQDAETE